MKNVHPTIANALVVAMPPHFFTVAVQHAKGERGCVLAADDLHDAHIKGLERVALRADEIPMGGVEMHVTELKAQAVTQ